MGRLWRNGWGKQVVWWERGAHLNYWEATSPGNKLPIPNSKIQRSTRSQAPNTKLQTPEKLQAPSSKLEARAAVWSLELGISLVFGSWFLVFRFRNFSGAWGLVLGVYDHHWSLDSYPSTLNSQN